MCTRFGADWAFSDWTPRSHDHGAATDIRNDRYVAHAELTSTDQIQTNEDTSEILKIKRYECVGERRLLPFLLAWRRDATDLGGVGWGCGGVCCDAALSESSADGEKGSEAPLAVDGRVRFRKHKGSTMLFTS